MIYKSGFYKLDGNLLYGPNFVLNAAYELRKETKDQHVYPTDGWYWFDTLEEACLSFDINIDEYQKTGEEGLTV
jgi:hypothetical protein